jgi:hypothetical protein
MSPQLARDETNVCRMMEHLGIEPGAGAVPRLGLRYATAFHRCRSCSAKQDCGAWLQGAAAAMLPPSFCPNADILFELVFDQGGRCPPRS